jgi:hypothetical protein
MIKRSLPWDLLDGQTNTRPYLTYRITLGQCRLGQRADLVKYCGICLAEIANFLDCTDLVE